MMVGFFFFLDKVLSLNEHSKLREGLEYIRDNLSCSVVLGFNGFEILDASVISDWLCDDLLNSSICFGNNKFALNDLLEAAVRLGVDKAIFVDAEILFYKDEDRFELFSLLNFDSGVYFDKDLSYAVLSRDEVLLYTKVSFVTAWENSLKILKLKLEDHNFDTSFLPVGKFSFKESKQLFVTKTGLLRFGGISNFSQLEFIIGGLPISSFTEIVILNSADSDEQKAGHVQSVFISKPDMKAILFDIYPSPHGYSEMPALDGCISIPRQVVVGRKHADYKTNICGSNDEAIFIMSNYNKSEYIGCALYSWAMQSYDNIRLHIIDDASTDNSVEIVFRFLKTLGVGFLDKISFELNDRNKGTYWIRNKIISQYMRENVVFLVSDSDDFNSSMRAESQVGWMNQNLNSEGCLFDIARVDGEYFYLPLNGEVERYGTATLCFRPSLIEKIGFFQNIKRNADTEFIRRAKKFLGEKIIWRRHPVLFQPFDGKGLTSDIYRVINGQISANLDLRNKHLLISEKFYTQLSSKDLPLVFGYPLTLFDKTFDALGESFLINNAIDKIFIYGSCCSRDALEFFVGDRKKKLLSHLVYFARSSLISQFSKKLFHGFNVNLASSWQAKMVEFDFNRSLKSELLKANPDLILLDFIDERFHIGFVGESAITLSIECKKVIANTEIELDRVVRSTSDEFYSLWENAWSKFVVFLKENNFISRVRINNVLWAYESSSGKKYHPDDQGYIDLNNAFLSRLYKRVSLDLSPKQFIHGKDDLFIGSDNHKWGMAPFHYEDFVYERIVERVF